MKRIIAPVILFSIFITNCAFANKIVRVGVIAHTPPIAFTDNQNNYNGIAIDLWREVAQEANISFKFVPISTTYNQAVNDLAVHKYDVLVGAFSVTHGRMKKVDFSRPFFLNKVGVVVREKGLNFLDTLHSIFGITLLLLLIFFCIAFFLFSHLFWLSERGRTRQVSTRYADGIKEAMWTTIVSFLRDVLYDPKSTRARIILGFWLLLSVIFMATISAVVTATLTFTLTQSHQTFKHISDLNNKLIAVEAGTSDVEVAKKTGAKLILQSTFTKCIASLIKGEVDGIVTDYYIAKHTLKDYSREKIMLSNLILTNDEYAFVLPKKSNLRSEIDMALTYVQESGKAANICGKYIYPDTHSCEF